VPKIGVVLSGCGVYDGSEIHEAVSVLLALDQLGAECQCMAPDADQLHVVNHFTGEQAPGEQRQVLAEAARIARGKIVALSTVRISDYDGFVFPGGFGAAKNLCTFALDGVECSVNADVKRLIEVANDAGKPLCFCCISPVIAAKVLGHRGEPLLTIGNDAETAAALEKMNAAHEQATVLEAVVDRDNKVVSTPAYMYGEASISEIYAGIRQAVDETLRLIG
jgi:enhancing lycopene biosynthesis protein 2